MGSQSNLTFSYIDIVYFLLLNSSSALNDLIDAIIGISEGFSITHH